MKPLRISVRVGASGLWIADSPDLPGLHAMERSETELKSTLRELIPLLLREQGVHVEVGSIEPVKDQDGPDAWVVAGLKTAAAVKVR